MVLTRRVIKDHHRTPVLILMTSLMVDRNRLHIRPTIIATTVDLPHQKILMRLRELQDMPLQGDRIEYMEVIKLSGHWSLIVCQMTYRIAAVKLFFNYSNN